MSENDSKYGENIAEQKYNIDHNWYGRVQSRILEQKCIIYMMLCKLDDELIEFFPPDWIANKNTKKMSIITHQKWGVAATNP